MYEVFSINQISQTGPYITFKIEIHENYAYEWIQLIVLHRKKKKEFYTENSRKKQLFVVILTLQKSGFAAFLFLVAKCMCITLKVEIMFAIKIDKFNISVIKF